MACSDYTPGGYKSNRINYPLLEAAATWESLLRNENDRGSMGGMNLPKGCVVLASVGVYALRFMDMLGFKTMARRGFACLAKAEHDPYVVYMGAKGLLESGEEGSAQTLLEDALSIRPSLRCGRLLVHIYLKQKQYKKAFDAVKRLTLVYPDNPWPHLLLGDIEYFFLQDKEAAFTTFSEAFEISKNSSYKFPIRVAYKRMCRLFEEKGMKEELVKYLEEFMALKPSNFHEHEFVVLARAQAAAGQWEKAHDTLILGITATPKSAVLRETWESLGFDVDYLPKFSPSSRSLPDGVSLTAIRTPLLTESHDPVEVMKTLVPGAKPGDVVTLSSCVAAIMEGRMLMEGACEPGFWAKLLSRFVDQTDAPFAGTVPMANPLSMQVLLEEIGPPRTIFAAVAGALGKLLRQKGWFYVVAGEDSGQIDDVLGCIPPYDYYSIMGPKDSHGISQQIADELGCEAAIIDACDLGIAWAVGYSKGVDKAWLESVMSSNPAGNQEQQTPIVLVRKTR